MTGASNYGLKARVPFPQPSKSCKGATISGALDHKSPKFNPQGICD